MRDQLEKITPPDLGKVKPPLTAAGSRVVGIPKHGAGHHLLGTASSREEAAVVATILRLFNPN